MAGLFTTEEIDDAYLSVVTDTLNSNSICTYTSKRALELFCVTWVNKLHYFFVKQLYRVLLSKFNINIKFCFGFRRFFVY